MCLNCCFCSKELINRIALRYGKSGDDAVNNIQVGLVVDVASLDSHIRTLAQLMDSEGDYALVVIDTFIQPFSTTYPDNKQWYAKAESVSKMLTHLAIVAARFNVAVVLTSHETAAVFESNRPVSGPSAYSTPQKRRRDGTGTWPFSYGNSKKLII